MAPTKRVTLCTLICITATAQALAQETRERLAEASVPTWIFFAPKDVSSSRLALREQSLELAARARREWRRTSPGLVDARDLPLRAADVELVRGIASLRTESRWLNAVSVLASSHQLELLRALPCVQSTQPVRRGKRASEACFAIASGMCDDASSLAVNDGYASRDFYGAASAQLTQINLPYLHSRGFTGAGVIVAVLDTGFERQHRCFQNLANPLMVLAERDFINGDLYTGIQPGDDINQHGHGTLVLSCMAAYDPNIYVGAAYSATYVLCKTEDVTSETIVEEDYYAAAIEFAESVGADVTTSSLGYIDWYTQADLDGRTAITTIALNIAAENGVHACTAAGNGGNDQNPMTSTLIAPADALNVLTCGSVNFGGASSEFSSDGPTADGRVKPELLARGEDTFFAHPHNVTDYVTGSGTSLATPLLAGVVACLTQAHPEWTVGQMRAALLTTASDYVQTLTTDPLFVRGYGIVDAGAALQYGCAADFDGNGGIDGADISAFFLAWQASEPRGDVNIDGGIDGSDIEAFFIVWTAGGC